MLKACGLPRVALPTHVLQKPAVLVSVSETADRLADIADLDPIPERVPNRVARRSDDAIPAPEPLIDRGRWLRRCDYDGYHGERQDRPSHAATSL